MTDRYESRASTHADDCWSWGPGHYKCAVAKIERLREALEDIRDRSLIDLVMRSDRFELINLLSDIYQIANSELGEEVGND